LKTVFSESLIVVFLNYKKFLNFPEVFEQFCKLSFIKMAIPVTSRVTLNSPTRLEKISAGMAEKARGRKFLLVRPQ
jgi:hypothetical protein